MPLEVELKFSVVDQTRLLAELNALGCRWEAPVDQCDLYFAHPDRDFGQTDEALRLRRTGNEACITYKGPKLDATTKTRREIELPIHADYDSYRELLEALGFRAVREVRKIRTPGMLLWQDAEITISVDDVVGLGRFIELELMASPEGLAVARDRLLSLASRLGLEHSERRGYLDLLLEKGHP